MNKRYEWTMRSVAALILMAPFAGNAGGFSESSQLSIPLVRVGGPDNVSGTMDFRSSKGRSALKLRIKGAPPNQELELIVGGIGWGTFRTSSGGAANLQFQSGSGSGRKRLLDFDPRRDEVEIEDASDDTLLRSRTDDGSVPDGSVVRENVRLLPTGVQPLASGHARYSESRGRKQFFVQIEDMINGTYHVLVDGVVAGDITTSLGRGELEFANPTDDPAKQPLTFDPYGKLVQVADGSTIVLAGMMHASAPGVNQCTPGENTTALANVGPDPDASGEARLRIRDTCRRDFRVEVEDLPVGNYNLLVGGVVRAIITVQTVVGGTEGEVEFSTDLSEAGKLPLSFDPTGQTIEVQQGATVFLAATGGSPNPGNCNEMDVEPNMTNSGADPDAKGKARFRQETDCDRNFRVEIEDLPLGNYELRVNGVVRGTITVQMVGGEPVGHIEFDTDPDKPGELLLNFDPRGKLVEVRQGSTTYLTVTMPD